MSKIENYSGQTLVESIDDLNEFITSNNGNQNQIAIMLFDDKTKQDKNYFLLDNILLNIDSCVKSGLKNINLIVPFERIPKNNFKKICEFYSNLNGKLNINICVNHRKVDEKYNYDKTKQVQWDIKTIVKANSEIDRVCNFIKKCDFSPLETLAFIHEYVGSIAEYNVSKTSKHTWWEKDQFFAGAFMELPEIICSGFSSLEKEIIDTLNIPGLKCEIIGVDYDDEEEMEHDSHSRCYIQVDDPKYKVKKSCFDDTTWDRKTKDVIGTYDCFAMSNKCFDKKLNGKYSYRNPYFMKLNKQNSITEIIDYNSSIDDYNLGENDISQRMIEEIYFNMLQKTNQTKSFDAIYSVIEKKTEHSKEFQNKRKYDGYIKSGSPELTKTEAKKLYNDNKKAFLSKENKTEISL